MKKFDHVAGVICAVAIWLLSLGTRCVRCEMPNDVVVELHGVWCFLFGGWHQ